MNKHNYQFHIKIILIIGASLFASACSNKTEATPTHDPVLIQTEAVATFSTGLTQTSLAMPSATSTVTPSPSPTENFHSYRDIHDCRGNPSDQFLQCSDLCF